MNKKLISIAITLAVFNLTGCEPDENTYNEEIINNYYCDADDDVVQPEYTFVEDDWYRDIRFTDWAKMGVSEEDVTLVLARIDSGKAIRDESNLDKKGYWTYEFSKEANKILKQAKILDDADLYQKASTLFNIAAYPNLRRSHELYAMDKALTYYVKALQMKGNDVELVKLPLEDGSTIKGVMHWPIDHTDDKTIPAMIWTGGVDKSLIEHYDAFSEPLKKGYAVLTLDMPGGGTDAKRSIKPQIIKEPLLDI